ncbi:nucleoside deaminase [Citrobacter amalonaticus]|uniref:Nucleoside deaminase n=1 Tax=Citrobacter amalonaticus TaxID=35703 RepID=A0A2S4S3P2_CITAM|nr:nucleoside deaminase [Citrobacter amalonaticus]POT59905.1 nucleoside deaminase [Citrobacter amalonaticus]POT78036.1 nucleoside deaminase [Citrobacter amalonaticus]POU68488.1 nucleoside deaminase [Citrobacter amalonaticus]POV08091.1 nucleoside deaminase [Citrobacter amalonaticus]
MSSHEHYLQQALTLAARNVEQGGRPFGAVIVRNGEAIAQAVNTMHLDDDPTGHAELNGIRTVSAQSGSAALRDCVVYASGQPCPMCLSAMYLTGVKEVWFANSNADGEPFRLSTAAIYQQLRLLTEQQSLPVHHLPQHNGIALYQRWAEKQS